MAKLTLKLVNEDHSMSQERILVLDEKRCSPNFGASQSLHIVANRKQTSLGWAVCILIVSSHFHLLHIAGEAMRPVTRTSIPEARDTNRRPGHGCSTLK